MTLLLEEPAVDTKPSHGSGDRPSQAHIVGSGGGKDGQTRVTEAMVFGHEVEALCGYIWVPTRDPAGLPVCPKCKSIVENTMGLP